MGNRARRGRDTLPARSSRIRWKATLAEWRGRVWVLEVLSHITGEWAPREVGAEEETREGHSGGEVD